MTGVSSLYLHAECKFPDPCGQMLEQYEVIAHSSKLQKEIEKEALTEGSFNWAWEKLFHQVSYGGKRLNEAIPEGIPAGEVLVDKHGLHVYVDKEQYGNVLGFTLYENGKKLWSQKEPSNSFYIPPKYLKYDHSYQWSVAIQMPGRVLQLKDEFHIVTKQEHVKMAKSMKLMESGMGNTTLYRFLAAVQYFDYGYDYNGNTLISLLKKEQ